MRKFLVIIMLSLILSGGAYANPESIKKDGFVIPTNKWKDKIKINENFEVNNPKDKKNILKDRPIDKNKPFWKSADLASFNLFIVLMLYLASEAVL